MTPLRFANSITCWGRLLLVGLLCIGGIRAHAQSDRWTPSKQPMQAIDMAAQRPAIALPSTAPAQTAAGQSAAGQHAVGQSAAGQNYAIDPSRRLAYQPPSVQTLPVQTLPPINGPVTSPAFPPFQPVPGLAAPSPSDNFGYTQPVPPGITSPYNSGVYPTNPQAPFPSAGNVFPPGASLGSPIPDYTAIQAGPQRIIAPIDVYLQEKRTGRVIIGGTVNSDLGVSGGLIIEERNFNIRSLQPGPNFLLGGRQHLRIEAMPGTEVQRYTFSWTQPNLFGVSPYSLSLGGFFYTRELRDWQEQRYGGRIGLGYEINRILSISTEIRAEDVEVFRPRIMGVGDLDAALGSNDVYRARFKITRDTRDSPFLSSAGGLLSFTFDQVFGEYDYPRGEVKWLRYWTLGEPLDPSQGLNTISHSLTVGISGAQTPIFDNYYAGGYSTLRGFDFRGASPREADVEVGGELSLLGSLEYAMPLTVDNMLRGVAFVDYGTVERDIEIDPDNFRVSLGLGLRLSVPALGPAPFALDFAYPVAQADTDDRQLISFYVGAIR